MFIKKLPYFLRFIDEPTEGGGGTEQQSEFSSGVPFEDQTQDNPPAEQQEQQSEPGFNPAWNPVLEKLPKEFHNQIAPSLKEWDSNFAKVQSQFSPYKPFAEQGIDPERISKSIELANLFATDPKLIYDELERRFGFSGQGQQQIQEPQQQQEQQQQEFQIPDPNDPNAVDLSKNPQFAQYAQQQQQIAQQQEAMNNFLQQQAQVEQERQAEQSINAEWQQIESKTGNLHPDVKAEIIRRSVFMGDQDGNYSITRGYQDYAAWVSRVRNERANNTAPDVLGGNGGLPVSSKDYGTMDESERVDYIAQYAKALAEGQK